jgi:site-specific DNA-methyltransferase (cytosine-N4-specific)
MNNLPVKVYGTDLGSMYWGDSLQLILDMEDESINLVLTSPPFALTREKEYGNRSEDKYVEWFMPFAKEFQRILKSDGSLVIDLGGAWLPGKPTRSLYQYHMLIALVEELGFHMAEDFYWFNRAKLPGPRQWTTIDRVRVKDSVNLIFWLSKTPNPKADNRRVLVPYSKAMQRLLERGTYNAGPRPSEHVIGSNWAKDLGGAIPPNVFELDEVSSDIMDQRCEPDNMLAFANTSSGDSYQVFCRANQIRSHPARFPWRVPEFFVKFLTDPGDLVLDPFGGSNVTGAVAEEHHRKWITCEIDIDYVRGSVGRLLGSAGGIITPDGEALGLSFDADSGQYKG